ncbi:MAG: exopolysaccharide Pel transporter PelG [Lachnospiraceae bacterium]|nr:exopolysaccharide Pel transporter PelG [Lachnospiraceae bacterium]
MAGIGFELKKIFQKKGVLAMFRAYGYAGIICTGPMLLGIVLLLGMMMMAQLWGVGKAERDLLVSMLTYVLLGSLSVTSIFSMLLTRYTADMLFEDRKEYVLPSFYGGCMVMLAMGLPLYGVFLYFSGISTGLQLVNLILFGELIVVWTQMNYLTAIRDYRGILTAFAASLPAAFLTALCLLWLHVEPKMALLSGVCTGYGLLLMSYLILLLQYFPKSRGSSFSFLRWIDRYLPLVIVGGAQNLGLFFPLVIVWFSPVGQRMQGLFYGAPIHDVPALLAFLTIVITTVNFVTSVEVNFYPKYRNYYSLFNGKGSIRDIRQAEEEMLTVLANELLYTARKQLYMTALAISVGVILVDSLPLGFNDTMNTYFRILCVSYGMYAVGNMVLLILLYFTDYLGAMWAALVFAAVSCVMSAWLAFFHVRYIGFGFFFGSAALFLISVIRLKWFTGKLPYHILSTQPILAGHKKGVFHHLCERIEKKGFLILLCGGLMATVGLTGCQSFHGTAKSQEIKTEQSGQETVTKTQPEETFRDRDALYENQDPGEVKVLYLTVRTGNSAENTDHTWTDLNSYSVYDYDKLGVARYQVEGILQEGDESGPIEGEFGFGADVPNATVQIRGQTSSKSPQKNYKIEIKKNKGTIDGQRTIALNKHVNDGLRYRNKLAYDLMAQIPQMMSLRTQFVHLYVRDQTTGSQEEAFSDYGLYTQVEQPNKTSLKAHGLDSNGYLYKLNYFEFFRYEDVIKLQTDADFDQKAFDALLESKGNNDQSKLITMLDAVDNYEIPVEDLLSQYFDEENLAYWMAYQILTGNTDTDARNLYLYSATNSEKWYLISWDNDASFMKAENALNGYSDGGSWQQGISTYWGNVLFCRCLKSSEFRQKLDDAVEDLKGGVLSEAHLKKMTDSYRQVTRAYAYQLPDSTYERLTPEQYESVADGLPSLVDDYYQGYEESLKKPMPFFIGLPQASEGKIRYNWDDSFDFHMEDITYHLTLSSDAAFTNIISDNPGLRETELTLDALPQGQYFVRVQATNTSGYTQDAFDYYANTEGKQYGMKCFYVMADGSIEEDVYEEGAN